MSLFMWWGFLVGLHNSCYNGAMKRIKVFLITLFIVVLLGGLVIAMLGAGNNRAYQANVSDDLVIDVEVANGEDAGAVEDVLVLDFGTQDADAMTDDGDQDAKELTGYERDLAMYEGAERTSVIRPASDEQVTITFAGDVLFDPGYAIYSTYKLHGSNIENSIDTSVLKIMRDSDIMMINNEFPYSDRGEPQPDKTYTFRAPTSTVSILDDMGVDIVSVANNHTFDYGEVAFVDTINTLENAQMPYVGAGMNIEEAVKPYYFVANGMRIAIVGATQIERNSNPNTRGATETKPGVFRCLDPELLCQAISEAKANSDFVILYIHWGTESVDTLDWCQTQQDHLYVEAGADAIIGAHPHCLQEIGYIDGVPIVYSLGNFWFNSKAVDTCLVTLTLSKEGIDSIQFIPCLQVGCSVREASAEDRSRIITYMNSISTRAIIDENGFVSPR